MVTCVHVLIYCQWLPATRQELSTLPMWWVFNIRKLTPPVLLIVSVWSSCYAANVFHIFLLLFLRRWRLCVSLQNAQVRYSVSVSRAAEETCPRYVVHWSRSQSCAEAKRCQAVGCWVWVGLRPVSAGLYRDHTLHTTPWIEPSIWWISSLSMASLVL